MNMTILSLCRAFALEGLRASVHFGKRVGWPTTKGKLVVLEILFWILLILTALGALVPDTASPYVGRGRWIVALVCIAILGLRVFGGIH